MLITDSWDIPASGSRSNEQKWTSQRLCLYSPQYSRPSVGLYYPLQPTSLHLPTRKLYRFHLFLPEFVSLENAFHFINGFQTSFSVKLSITEILTENPKSICQEQRCSHVKQGAAGGHSWDFLVSRDSYQLLHCFQCSGTLSFNKAVFPSAH